MSTLLHLLDKLAVDLGSLGFVAPLVDFGDLVSKFGRLARKAHERTDKNKPAQDGGNASDPLHAVVTATSTLVVLATLLVVLLVPFHREVIVASLVVILFEVMVLLVKIPAVALVQK